MNILRVIVDKLNARIAKLESELADVKAKRDTLMGCFFEFETVAPNGKLMASVLDMNKRILELEAENKALKDLSERLIDAGEYLAESYRENWTEDDEPAHPWRWNALVAEWQKAKES